MPARACTKITVDEVCPGVGVGVGVGVAARVPLSKQRDASRSTKKEIEKEEACEKRRGVIFSHTLSYQPLLSLSHKKKKVLQKG